MRRGWRRSNAPRGRLETITAGISDKKRDNIVTPWIGECKPNEDGWVFHSVVVKALQKRPFNCPVVLPLSVTLKDFSCSLVPWSEPGRDNLTSVTSNMRRKYSKLFWHSCLMGVNSIIKIELTINASARSYAVILTLFIEVFGVIYWRLSNVKEKESVHMVV